MNIHSVVLIFIFKNYFQQEYYTMAPWKCKIEPPRISGIEDLKYQLAVF